MTSLITENKLNYIKLNYVLIPRVTTVLREKFKKHWHAARKAYWIEEDGKSFVEGSGREIYVTTSRRRKKLLRSGRIELWNLNLFGDVLLKYDFGETAKPTKGTKKLIKTLLEICADVKSQPKREINKEDFDFAWQNVEKLLIKLGDSQIKLKALKTEQLRSMEMKTHSDRGLSFREFGNKFFNEKKFSDAIMFYTHGIMTQRCKIESALLYSNRATAYLQLCIHIAFFWQRIRVAKDDIKNSIELCPTWYKSHYKLAMMYEELKKSKKCIQYLEIALSLDPKNKKIREKLLEMTLIDQPGTWEREVECPEDFAVQEISHLFLGGSYLTLWQAKCYLHGWKVLKNHQLAEELYSKAADAGNFVAMVDLANMYECGQVVKRNTKKYIELLKKATSKPEYVADGRLHQEYVNAEWYLGISYEKGLGVIVDLKEAITWYEKAWKHGHASAACTLGELYLKGSGVEKDEDRGVFYLKKAANMNFGDAFMHLSEYYVSSEFDSEEALLWYKKAAMAGKASGGKELDVFVEIAAHLNQYFDFDKICEWEKEKGFSSQGLLMRDRRRRYVNENTPYFEEFEEKCHEWFWSSVKHEGDMPAISVEKVLKEYKYPFELNELRELAEKGSVTAKRIEKAVTHFGNALKCLRIVSSSIPSRLSLVSELSHCFETEPSVAKWNDGDRKKAGSVVDELLNEMASIKSNIQFACCVCYCYFHANEYAKLRKTLVNCVENYPEEIYFAKMLGNTLLSLGEYAEGLKECGKALDRFPGDCELLLSRAKLLQGFKEGRVKVVKAFEDFLVAAPSDHPDVPAVYYEIAILYSQGKSENQDKVGEYYQKGLEAEKIQLPCFLPCKFRNDDRFKKLLQLVTRTDDSVSAKEAKFEKLMDPSRVESIVKFREKLAKVSLIKEIEDGLIKNVKQRAPAQLAEIKFISLNEMEGRKDHLQEGLAVKVTIIEDYIVTNCIHLLVEDEERDVSHVVICNFSMEDGDEKKFAYGAKIVIMNPYVKPIEDGKTLIVIKDIKSLSFENGKKKLCRFCRNGNAKKKCGKCQKVNYCSKQCQLSDWNVMKHNICCKK